MSLLQFLLNVNNGNVTPLNDSQNIDFSTYLHCNSNFAQYSNNYV